MNWFPPELDFLIGCNRWQANLIRSKSRVRNVTGSNASFSKQAYEAVGGFNQRLGALSISRIKWQHDSGKWTELGEETKLCIRLANKNNGYIMFNPNLIVYHKIKKKVNLKFLISMAFRTGRTKGLLRREFKDDRRLLADEMGLLRVIALKTAKECTTGFLNHPSKSMRIMLTITTTLFFVAFGFLLGNISDLRPAD